MIYRHVIWNARPIALTLSIAQLLGCASKPQNQPSAQEQTKIQEEYESTMKQQKQLTSGYGRSMQYVQPSTGYAPPKNSKQHQVPANQQRIEQAQPHQ